MTKPKFLNAFSAQNLTLWSAEYKYAKNKSGKTESLFYSAREAIPH